MEQLVLADNVTVSGTGLTGGESTIVGTPPVLEDDSDASYVEFQGYYFPGDPQFTGTLTAMMQPEPTVPTNIRSVIVRMRVAAIAGSNVRLPRVIIDTADGGRLQAYPTDLTPGSAGWAEVELTERAAGDYARFAQAIRANEVGIVVAGALYGGEYGGTVPSETQKWRVYELEVWVKLLAYAPPCRLFPRDDGLGVGSGRHFPPPKSQQRSSRRFGYY